jgi:peptidoglycan/xylan/chitin deacetylase (PgdA/CDA1 family)
MNGAEPRVGVAKRMKRALLGATRAAGGFGLAKVSAWRRGKLLVLAYHGISLEDEHEWDSNLFMSAARFEQRLEILRSGGYAVLPLEEGLQRAAKGDLPQASVAITFDDGLYCFHKTALPALERYGYPATLYLTTYYCERQAPVFDVALPYALWKARERGLDLAGLTGDKERFGLADAGSRATASAKLRVFAGNRGMGGAAKQDLLEQVGEQIGVDIAGLCRARLFNLMTPEETADASRRGVSIELHTHRHRAPLDRELFLREIDDNRARIEEMTGKPPRHFCYPSGVWDRAFFPWLEERGVASATTCEPGLTGRTTAPLRVPRLVDVTSLDDREFEGWLCGVSALLPRSSIG